LLLSEAREKLALERYGEIAHLADCLLEDAGITIARTSIEYQKFCRELLKGIVEASTVDIERMRGNYANPFDRKFSYLSSPVASPSALASARTGSSERVSELVGEYVKEHSEGGNWTAKTQAESEGIYKLFVEFVGDCEARMLDHRTLSTFRAALLRFPSNVTKKKEYRGKTIHEILKMDVDVPLSKTSVEKYMIRIGAFLKWAAKHKYIEANFADGLTVLKKDRKEEEERDAYSEEDLQRLIGSPLYTSPRREDHPERYWIPLIGLYSGMRLNEICQLHLEDIKEVDGIVCFDINDDGEKRLKNISSRRIIPVHPILLKLDFLEYVQGLREKGGKRLWENLARKRDGYAQDFSKWYQRFNRKEITDNPKRVFHSFRHTLANNLKQNGVDEPVIAEILGHSHNSITSGRYGKRYEPEILQNALERLTYGIEDELKNVARFPSKGV
jgi:integrase